MTPNDEICKKCVTHARDWQETRDGKYPPSKHSPGCEEYRPERFAIIEHDGAWCVVESHNIDDFLTDAEIGEVYTISFIALTRDQVESMPDFEGF